jgi:hypothetical protein
MQIDKRSFALGVLAVPATKYLIKRLTRKIGKKITAGLETMSAVADTIEKLDLDVKSEDDKVVVTVTPKDSEFIGDSPPAMPPLVWPALDRTHSDEITS